MASFPLVASIAQPLVEVGGGHAAVADLTHHDVAVLWGQATVDGSGRVLVVHDAVLGQRGEGLVGGRDRVPVGLGEADAYVGDGAAVGANVGDGPFHAADQGVAVPAFGACGLQR